MRQKDYKAKKKKPKKKTQQEWADEKGLSLMTYRRRLKAAGGDPNKVQAAEKCGALSSEQKSGDTPIINIGLSTKSNLDIGPSPENRSPAANTAAPCAPASAGIDPNTSRATPLPDPARAGINQESTNMQHDGAHAPADAEPIEARDKPGQRFRVSEPIEPAPTGAPADAPAFEAVRKTVERCMARGEEIEATNVLWFAAKNVWPPVPADILGGDDDAIAGYLVRFGHLTEAQLAWIMDGNRPAWTDARAKPAKQPVQAGSSSGRSKAASGNEAAPGRAPALRRPVLRHPGWRDDTLEDDHAA